MSEIKTDMEISCPKICCSKVYLCPRPVVKFFPTYYDVIVTSSKSRKSQKYTIFVKTCYFDNFKLLYPML